MATSDAYMELSDPDVWGETHDQQFGMEKGGRKLGAFEISKFDFGVSTEDTKDDSKSKSAHAVDHGKGASKHKPPDKGTFTISKFIDKASPDLFLACCKKDKIDWGIICVRETGEVKRKPYLVLEFRKLHVTSFKWDLSPGDPESAATIETVTFECETILIKYSRQSSTGEHTVVKMKGWNWAYPEDGVSELDSELEAEETLEDY